ncbi:MliC family protein [Erwinia sp. S43]|uniref:MliC family protein n=1 Tax=unclassified Erwinia TaxID=2622719 RepID=UPI00190AA91D|nr:MULTISPECIES: MliC family protein [unclassified Erwinia]MBK0030748.1 MliC family protein [Erwinia sp. S43]MCW1877588.1 MliC family protein [Erwinia sp. INIA01]
MKQGIFVAALLLSGCSYFQHSAEEQPKTLHYTCGTLPLTVQLNNAKSEVSMILDGNQLTLKQQVAASGTRYSDGNYVFWSKGDSAFIERNDKIIINDCQLQSAG